MPNEENARVAPRPSGNLPNTVALVVLFSAAAVIEAVRLSSLHSPDVWMHLRLGCWILGNKTWPTTGLFSQVPSLVWRDFNWSADAAVAVAYRFLGLSGVPALWMLYRVVLAGITYCLAGGSRENLYVPLVVSAVAQYLLYSFGPIGVGTSAAFFGLELLAFVASRRSGQMWPLLWLPLLFLFWTNFDLGFVYGVGLYVLYVAALSVEETISRRETKWLVKTVGQIRLGTAALVGVACLVASFLSPYGYHAYAAFFAIQSSPANQYLFAHAAMSFHRPQDYLLLLLSMTAFLLLGMRRSRDLFLISALIVCTGLSFRAQGDNWLGTLAAVAVIGDGLPLKNPVALAGRRRHWLILPTTVSIGVVLLCWLVFVPRDRTVLLSRVVGEFPVGACDYIRQHQLPSPLFNEYTWGGFLAWYLPEYPVAIDARRGLYPDDLESDYFQVMKADIPYQSLVLMKQARTLLLDKKGVMAQALQTLPGFRVAYEDKISIVLQQETQK